MKFQTLLQVFIRLKDRTHVTSGRRWERMGFTKAKKEESYPRSGN